MVRTIAILTLGLVLLAAPAAAPGQPLGRLTVIVTGFQSAAGQALLSIGRPGGRFPPDEPSLAARGRRPIEGGRAVFLFEGLPQGTYAAAAFHDQNGNGELDAGLLGRPREPHGFSNNARGLFGPASFEAAAFELDGPDKTITFAVK